MDACTLFQVFMMIYVTVVQILIFLCNKCSASTLPFYDISHLSNISTNSHHLTLSDSSISEGEDIFHELRLVRGRCKKNIIVSHLNINRLRNKFNDLSDLFSDKLVDILFISETKLDSTFKQGQFDVRGYKNFRKDKNAHGGGILAYFRADLPARQRPDLELLHRENIIIEITILGRKWTIVCVYRPTSMPNSTFLDNFTAGTDRVHVYFDNIMVIGDLNYDVNVPQKSQPLQSICYIFDYSNLITKPTCFTKNAPPSISDVILTNKPKLMFNVTNIMCAISDSHNIISVAIKGDAPPPKHRKIKYRSFKNFDEDAFS